MISDISMKAENTKSAKLATALEKLVTLTTALLKTLEIL